jgi:cytochrome P450 family 6
VDIFVFDQPSLVIRDLDLVKNAQNFIDRTMSADEKLGPLFARGLLVLKGQRWRYVRVNLTPVFTSAKMKMMFCLVEICCTELVKHLDIATPDGK